MKGLLFFILLFLSVGLHAQSLGIVASSSGGSSSYGAELIANGTFASGASWTLSSATITGGECVISGGAFTTFASQNIGITTGKSYKVEFDITSYSAGTLYILFGDWTYWEGPNSGYSANQHISIIIAYNDVSAPADIWFYSTSDGFTGHIDNVSVKEIL